MKSQKNRSWLTFGWLFVISMVSFGSELHKADSLFATGNYTLAALEYERVWYYSTDPDVRDHALMLKGECKKQEGAFHEAALTFARIPIRTNKDSLNYHCFFQTALCAYLSGDLFNAEERLLQMKEVVKDTHLLNQALYLEVIVYSEGEKWETARQSYAHFCQLHHLDTNAFHLIRHENELHLKSERKAIFLSLLLPGLGQTYAGKPWRGLSSLLFTAAAVTYGVISATQGLWITAFFTGFTYTLRFYSGGTKYAMKLVKNSNEKKKRDYKNAVKEQMLSLQNSF